MSEITLVQWHYRDYFIICKISQKWWHAGRFWENCPVFFTLFFKKRDSWFFLIIEWLWEFRRSFYLIGNFVIRKDLVFYLSSVAVSYIRKIPSILLFECIFWKTISQFALNSLCKIQFLCKIHKIQGKMWVRFGIICESKHCHSRA